MSRLPSAAAPGFVYLAGACRGLPVGGGGRDIAEATARLVGETAEVLAQLGPRCRATPGRPAIDEGWTTAPAPLRVPPSGGGGRPVGVPAAAIFLAAAPRRNERDGAAREPRARRRVRPGGGPARSAPRARRARRRGRLVARGAAPRQLDAGAAALAGAALAELRAGAAEPRATGFLALPRGPGCRSSARCRAGRGRGFAFGLKAALDPAAAALGALIELMQMELALEMARHRAARGGAAAGDRGPLARAALTPEDFAAFAAAQPARRPVRRPPGSPKWPRARGEGFVCRRRPAGARQRARGRQGLRAGVAAAARRTAAKPGTPGALAPLM